MARGSVQHQFDVELADVDRGVYETLALRVARHPSENDAYLVTRLLAYCLEYEEGIAFSRGLAEADEPAVWVKDLTGRLRASIELGTPEAARLHKASKASERVVVYCHKAVEPWARALERSRVHEADRITVVVLDRAFVDALAATVARRNAWGLSVTDGTIYLDANATTLESTPTRFEGLGAISS
jgi:uncharacterized protein YaeQ